MFKVISSSPTFGKYSEDPVKLLESNNCEIEILSSEITSNEEKFADAIKDADALIVGVENVTSHVLAGAKRLKIIAKHGAGVDNIDLNCARQKNIFVTNAPGANRNSVADLVFGLFLSIARQIPTAFTDIKGQQWPRIIGNEIFNKTIGVIGTGRIGKEVIRRAQGFNMKVLCYDRYPDKQFEQKTSVQYVDLSELLKKADFITLHTALTDDTYSLIGKEELKTMKSNAFIVNTARGGIIDEDALYEALINNEIKGAALDVFEKEPNVDSPLLTLPNFIATPHMGGYTVEALREVGMITARNVIDAVNEKEPAFLV